MKKITIKQEMVSAHIKWMIFTLFVFSVNTSFAQFQSNEPLYISDNGYVYIGSDNYYFGGGNGQTITSRTTSTYGKLIFAYPASAINASDAHYLDGYGSVITTKPFTFPVGQKGVYAPAKVIPSTKNAIDAAYYRSSPLTIGATLDVSIRAISSSEYWNIQGNNTALISLTWRSSSALDAMSLSMSDLVIAGYDGTKWVEIPSIIDTSSILGGDSSLTSGSITSIETVNLNVYKYFSMGVKENSLAQIEPTITNPVVNSAKENIELDTIAVKGIIKNQQITIKTSAPMATIQIFDTTGKKIFESKIENSTEFNAPFNNPQAIYIVKVILNNGKSASLKLINVK